MKTLGSFIEVTMIVREIANDLLIISKVLTLSHKSRGGTVAILRSGKHILNASAYSTINSWTPVHKIVQTSLLDAIGPRDGGKLSTFIITSLVDSLSRLPFNDRLSEIRKIESETDLLLRSIRSKPSDKEHLRSLDDDVELCKVLSEAIYESQGGHISLEKGDGVNSVMEQSESLMTDVVTRLLDDEITLKGAMVYLCPQSISRFSEIEPVLELMGTFPNRPLLIIAPMIGREVLSTLKLNRDKSIVDAYAIESPRVTWAKGWMDDVGAFTGATNHERTLEKFRLDMFGSAKEIVLNQNKMIITPYDEHIDSTIERADFLLNEAKTIPHNHTKDLWAKRASALTGSLVRVKIGAPTELEARVKRNKAEKVILSMSDMYHHGHVNGSIPFLAQINTQSEVLNKALKAPWRVVCRNLHKMTEDPSVLNLGALQEPFPFGRLKEIIQKSVSVGLLLSSVAISVKSK